MGLQVYPKLGSHAANGVWVLSQSLFPLLVVAGMYDGSMRGLPILVVGLFKLGYPGACLAGRGNGAGA